MAIHDATYGALWAVQLTIGGGLALILALALTPALASVLIV